MDVMRELPGKGVGGCMENLALTASDWSAGLRGRWIWHKETETDRHRERERERERENPRSRASDPDLNILVSHLSGQRQEDNYIYVFIIS